MTTTKTILITGCSSGIGLHTAITLKKRGYRVFATARKEADVDKLIALGLESMPLDVTDNQSISHALEQVLALTGGQLGALFNNAGYVQPGAIEDVSREMMRDQFETNVFGAMELTRQILPIMRSQGKGRIIMNSSILGVVALPFYGAYNASKFALEGFSNTLRLELRGTHIHVSTLNPGAIETRIRENAIAHYEHSIKLNQQSVHKDIYAKMETAYFHQKSQGVISLRPEAVAKKVILALESSRPKAHYFVGLPAQIMAITRRILPDCMMDWVLCRINRLST